MHRLCLLIMLAVVCPFVVGAGQAADLRPLQPMWLTAHLRLEQAGQQIVDGEYQRAHQLLVNGEAELPMPYRQMAARAKEELQSIFDKQTALDALRDGARDLEDLFGAPARRHGGDPFGPRDPFDGKPARRRFVEHKVNDLRQLAEICRNMQAYDAAVVMYRRAIAVQPNDALHYQLARCLYALHANPQEVEAMAEQIEEETYREVVSGYLEPLGKSRRAKTLVAYRLAHSHTDAGLVRLRELEALRPRVTSPEQRIQLLRAQARAFHDVGDMRARNEAYECILNDYGDRSETCGEILLSLAYLERRRGGQGVPTALGYFRRIVEEHPNCPQFGSALYALARELDGNGQSRAAINAWERLFAWAEADLEARTDWRKPPHVDLHHPASRLSTLYESQGNIDAALKYARLARDKYHYSSFCGTGYQEHLKHVRQRVTDLESLAKGTGLPRHGPLGAKVKLTPNVEFGFPLPQF